MAEGRKYTVVKGVCGIRYMFEVVGSDMKDIGTYCRIAENYEVQSIYEPHRKFIKTLSGARRFLKENYEANKKEG
jgi:hypothetical protein